MTQYPPGSAIVDQDDWYSLVAQSVAVDAQTLRDLADGCDDETKDDAERMEDSAYAAGEAARIAHRLLSARYEDRTRVIHDPERFRAVYGPAISPHTGIDGRVEALRALAHWIQDEADDHETGERWAHDPERRTRR